VERVRFGVMSTADIGMKKVTPAIAAAANCEVVAIASRDAERAAQAATQLGIPRSYGRYEDLLEDPGVDAVYIPLPNHLHAEWTILTAEAGKHVLCEKPLAMNAPEAEHVVAACADADVALMEAFMYRFHPSWAHVAHLVESDVVGDLQAVHTWFCYFNDDPDNIRNSAEAGGGALMDIGCYAVNLSRMLFDGEPASIQADVRRESVSGVDVLTSAVLGFDRGHASFTVSMRSEPHQRVVIVGTRGRIEIEIPFNIPPDIPTRVTLTAGGDPPVDPETEVLTFAPKDPYTAQAEAFAAAILAGAPVPLPPEDAVANMRVIDAIAAQG
jgi:predicted dehydrogenase